MSTTPVLSCRQVIRRLRKRGFREVRQTGAHKRFEHADGRATTVSDHGGKDLAAPVLQQIARDIGLTVAQFVHQK